MKLVSLEAHNYKKVCGQTSIQLQNVNVVIYELTRRIGYAMMIAAYQKHSAGLDVFFTSPYLAIVIGRGSPAAPMKQQVAQLQMYNRSIRVRLSQASLVTYRQGNFWECTH